MNNKHLMVAKRGIIGLLKRMNNLMGYLIPSGFTMKSVKKYLKENKLQENKLSQENIS